MTSIPAAICRISHNNFKRQHLKNKRLFLDFLLHFLKCAWNLEHFQKKDEYSILIISKVIDAETRGYLNV